MQQKNLVRLAAVTVTLWLPIGCGPGIADSQKEIEAKVAPFASREATLLDFQFVGELTTANDWYPERYVEDQIFFTVGQLNGDNSVGRLDKLLGKRLPSISSVAVGSLSNDIVSWPGHTSRNGLDGLQLDGIIVLLQFP